MIINTAKIILSSLSRDKEISSKIYPYLKEEYFDGYEKIVFQLVSDFITKYSQLPSKEAVLIELDKKEIKQNIYDDCIQCTETLFEYDLNTTNKDWIVDTAEKYCKDRAIHLALQESINIYDKISSGKVDGISETAIPELLLKAVSVGFDDRLGSDYIEDALDRYDSYNSEEDKIPFGLDIFNVITNGGFSKKTLNIFLAGTAGGKTLSACHMASDNLFNGQNVLYITLEIEEKLVAKRFDANLMDVDINDIHLIGKSSYNNNIQSIKKKSLGKIIIHDDLTGNFSGVKLKSLLENFKLKKNFVPDVIYVDYLGVMKSSIYKEGSTTSYIYFKSISEELRTVAKQYDVAIVSSVQLNRGAYDDSDAGLTGIADSWGITNTADWIGVIIQTEELKQLNQYLIKQLKSRYTDLSQNHRFYIGVDKPKMRLYDLEQNSHSIQDNTEYHNEIQDDSSSDDVLDKLKSFKKKNNLIFD